MESRFVFNETFAVIAGNPELPRESLVYHQLRVWYGDHAIMAVRRQIKVDPSAVSLMRLLTEIEEYAPQITRDQWLDSWDDWSGDAIASHSWVAIAGEDSATFPVARVQEDMAALRDAVHSLEAFADKRVAHHDLGKPPSTPTYDELNAGLDALDRIFRKYYRLVVGKWLLTTTPEIAYNWMKAYEKPWRVR